MEEFDLYVAGFFPNRGESPEEGLAKIFGIDQKQARALVRSLPRVIKKRVPADQVERYMRALRDIGADVELRRPPLAAQKTVTIGTSSPNESRPLTLPPAETVAAPRPSAASQTVVLYAPPAAPAVNPLRVAEVTSVEHVSPPVEPESPAAPAPEPAAASPWADLDLPVRGARISIRPPPASASASVQPPKDGGLGLGGRPAWMVEDSQYHADAEAPQDIPGDESLPITHSLPPEEPYPIDESADDSPEPPVEQAAVAESAPPAPPARNTKPASVRPPARKSRTSTARVSELSAPALRGREAGRASAYTGDYTRPVERREPSRIQLWVVRVAARLGIAMLVFGVLTLARSLGVLGDDVDAQVADWAAPLDPTLTSLAERAAAESGVAITAREWSSSTVNQWGNGDKDAVLRLVARLDAAGARGVFPSNVAKTGALSIASELRIELPEDMASRRAVDAVIREFRTSRSGARPIPPPPEDDDPFHGERSTFLTLD